MKKHFLQISYPGSFFAEQNLVPLSGDSWDLGEALAIVAGQDYAPFGFRFITRERQDDELDSKQVARSCMYFVNGDVKTVGEVEPGSILHRNMINNNYSRVFVSRGFTVPMDPEDIVCRL